MRLPWKRETRAETYSDAVISVLTEGVSTTPTSAAQIAAREIALGLWGRAFASAQVKPEGMADALTPAVLTLMGREIIRQGEAVFLIDLVDGALVLSPVCAWEISGAPDPSTWTYEVTRAGPSTTLATKNVSERRVVHARYAVEPNEPWRGVGPLGRAKTSATLAANAETRLSEELGQSAGEVLPVPDGKTKDQLQADLRQIRGRLALVESTASGWGDGAQGAPKRDLVQQRIGANPPAVLTALRSDAAIAVLATCGVPISLLEKTDGAALREAWRQFLHASVAPVARLAAAELSDKLDTPVTLGFDSLFASDLSGRARAFQSMVGGGMDVTKAAALAGLMDPT